MTRTEYLLGVAAEECAEIAQRCSKAQRFGLLQQQPHQPDTNAVRIVKEFVDLVAVLNMANLLLIDKDSRLPVNADLIAAKQQKVEDYLTNVEAADEKYTREVEPDPIAHAVSHWFIQGGEARFGKLAFGRDGREPANADELISAILRCVESRRT